MKRSRKPAARVAVLRYDVIYDDGSRASNRKVSADELVGDDQDEAARAYFEAQDRHIASVSGVPRGEIKSVARSRDA